MARPTRQTATTASTNTPTPLRPTPVALAPATPTDAQQSAAGPSRPTRVTRARRSLGAAGALASGSASPSVASSAASPAGGPLTPTNPNSPAPSSSASTPLGATRAHSKSFVEPKAHGLRNAQNAKERRAIPFPADFGGKDVCGIHDEDEQDDVLMAICGACASMVSTFCVPGVRCYGGDGESDPPSDRADCFFPG